MTNPPAKRKRLWLTPEQKHRVWPHIVAALHTTGAQWWICDGTALVAWRDRGWQAHDPDIDIGFWSADTQRVVQALQRIGQLDQRNPHHYKWSDTTPAGLAAVDLHMHTMTSEWVTYPLGAGAKQVIYRLPANLFRQFDTVVLDGHEVLIPSPPADYLRAHYGPGWRTPVTRWRYRKDPPCVVRPSLG